MVTGTAAGGKPGPKAPGERRLWLQARYGLGAERAFARPERVTPRQVCLASLQSGGSEQELLGKPVIASLRIKWGTALLFSLDPKKRSDANFFSALPRTISPFSCQNGLRAHAWVEVRGITTIPGSKFNQACGWRGRLMPSTLSGRQSLGPCERPLAPEADLALHQAVVPPAPSVLAFAGSGSVTILGSSDFGSEDLVCLLDRFIAFSLSSAFPWISPCFTNVITTSEAWRTRWFPFKWSSATALKGETYGGEVAATWGGTNWWRIKASYTLLQMQLHTKGSSSDTVSEAVEGDSPQNSFRFVRSGFTGTF